MDEPTLVVVAIGFLLGGLLLCCQVVAMEIQKRELRRLVAYWRHRTEAVEARLTRQLAEARERIAEMEPHSRWYKHREEINRRKNGSPCCCEFDDDDEPITQCAFHADLRRELAEARALLAERKWNPTEHPQ